MAVYFMQPIDGGPIKIGYSENVDRRRAELEAHFGRSLAILAVVEGGRKEEREMHDRFSHLRMEGTEQFKPARDLMEFIGRPLLVDLNPETVEVMPARLISIVLPLKGTSKWRRWLEGWANHLSLPSSAALVDTALKEKAERENYDPPPKRTGDHE